MRFSAPRALASAVGGRGEIVIRRAQPADGSALRRLGQLAERPVPMGEVLLAESDGVLVAAAAPDGSVITDPFVVTGDVVELLEVRGRQLLDAA
jgi:hypothetical protein